MKPEMTPSNRFLHFLLNNRISILIFLCIVCVYGLSWQQRQASYTYWMENRNEYVVDQVTAMSTYDAYWWLKMAKELDEGRLQPGESDPLKEYPDLAEYPDTPSLLARLISVAAKFTANDYYRAGLLLVPILSGFFVFPLFVCCNALGFGASAVLASLVGSFSIAYYQRTMMGSVDTDLLNTFFPLAASCCIMLMNRERTLRANLGLSAGAGLSLYLFVWWYQQPSIILAYLPFMASFLLLSRIQWQQVLWMLLLFLLAAGPVHVLQSGDSLMVFLRAYFFPSPTGQIVWPDILTQASEAQKAGILVTLQMIHGFLALCLAGLAGLLYLYLRRFRQMLPLTPIVLLGIWSLVGPKRFSMYLAPFIGMGAGVLIELLANFIRDRLRLRTLYTSLAAIALMLLLFFTTSAHTGFRLHPAPIISATTTKSFLDIKKIVPHHSAMLSWWDYGYALMGIGEFATYHDGSAQGGPRTTLTARAMTSTRQEEMVSLLAYLEDEGFNDLNSRIVTGNLSADAMQQLVFSYPGVFRGENIHVLYTEDMIGKFYSISFFGNWDFQQQQSEPLKYYTLTCFALENDTLTCKGGTVNLNSGILSDGVNNDPLNAILFVNNGYLVNQIDYRSDQQYYLQILMRDNKIFLVQMVDKRLFHTNFNQQFLLGNYDQRYFEEVYNNFPVARVLHVKEGIRVPVTASTP